MALELVQFELLVSYPSGGIKHAVGYRSLHLRNCQGQGLYVRRRIQHSSLHKWFLKPLGSLKSPRVRM